MNVDRDVSIHDDPGNNRFVADVEGKVAFVDFKRHGDTIWLTHTEVPPELEGRGIASALTKHALDYAKTHSLRVVPSCPFIAEYIGSHPEYAAIVKSERAPKDKK